MGTQQLVVDHLELAGAIAGHISKRLPRHLDIQDLHQDARLGLLCAAAAYDARKRVPFAAFARQRISGAIVDGLRQNDHLSRSARARVKAEGGEAPAPASLTFPDRIPGTLEPPDRHAAQAECQRLLNAAAAALPMRLRIVLHAYYHCGQTMRVIGENLGISEGRVSQIHARALRLLRRHFNRLGFRSSADFMLPERIAGVWP